MQVNTVLKMLKTPRAREFNTFDSVATSTPALQPDDVAPSCALKRPAAPLDEEATRKRYSQVHPYHLLCGQYPYSNPDQTIPPPPHTHTIC